MYVGNAYPHKNLEKLIKAFSGMKAEEEKLSLVLVGKADYFYDNLKKIVTEKKVRNVIFAGFVPDHDLDTVYKNARLYVFPSLYEGFGIPPLEAMAKGVPVAVSDIPCMREILGESVEYFDATDENVIKKTIQEVLQNEDLCQKLVRKGYEQIAKYSWEKMARETMEIYKKLA